MTDCQRVDEPVAIEVDRQCAVGCHLIAETDFCGDVDESAISPGDERCRLSVRPAEKHLVTPIAVDVDGGGRQERMASRLRPPVREWHLNRHQHGLGNTRGRRPNGLHWSQHRVGRDGEQDQQHGEAAQKFAQYFDLQHSPPRASPPYASHRRRANTPVAARARASCRAPRYSWPSGPDRSTFRATANGQGRC